VTINFHLFGPAHLAILASIPGTAAILSVAARHTPAWGRAVRFALGGFLAINELTGYGYSLWHEGWRFPEGLPLQLCDLALWSTVIAALSLNSWAFESAYFVGLGGSTMALITPDLWAPLPSYPTVYFFLAHGSVVVTVLTLTWGGLAKLRHGCVWRTFAIMNGFAMTVAIFNVFFKTNYMYLCRKPASTSLLDYFGPWPVYIGVGEVFALGLFWLLWLPVRYSATLGGPRAGTRSGGADQMGN
jgi:hypothetical integral membrane protein (TIGR02206 family)